ncbi:protein CcmA, bactofilin family [Marinobacter daqiaonensis]|uniref:Protein CcmA, bactofilin family n=1 Tax=Marinobacter daqiaonensis TaxID=650891 RepID=A0A1I6JY59_9GAMM|nr:polymer-forming cytoskeletal protein [Marinobacter daqiaonensis]SFR83470.1 protein CcmA, bactofilin family [Marinobacter daqiaonensis]
MLSKKKQKPKRPQGHFDTLISAKTTVEGNIRFCGGLHVDGKVQGNIMAEEQADTALIRVSECGEVQGDIVAPHIVINGTVTGDVFALSHLELAEKAAIKGNVFYNLIQMEAGASVNGNMVHSKDPDALPRPARLNAPLTRGPVDQTGDELPEDSPGEPGVNPLDEALPAGGSKE